MRKVYLFMMISLDGYFEGPNHDLSWHNTDEEFQEFALEQLNDTDTILFGRKTYEMMASFWPSEEAQKDDPVTAELMTSTPKVVFSKTLNDVSWSNTKLVKGDAALEIKDLKAQPGKDIAIFGSNNLSVSLAEQGLVDGFRIMVNPVAIGEGTALFKGIKQRLNLKLTDTREFKNGNILLSYTNG